MKIPCNKISGFSANAMYALSELNNLSSARIKPALNEIGADFLAETLKDGSLNVSLVKKYNKFTKTNVNDFDARNFANKADDVFTSCCDKDLSEITYQTSQKTVKLLDKNFKPIETNISPNGPKNIWINKLGNFLNNCEDFIKNNKN